MLNPRIIPILLLDNEGLVKTTSFKNPRYIGDPLNAIRIFNEKEADELVLLDITASIEGREPNFSLIERVANECRMPLGYGGGIKNFYQANRILTLGVEKIIVSSLYFENISEIKEMIKVFGNQSVVLCLDVKKKYFSKEYYVLYNRGHSNPNISVIECIQNAAKLGIGEIIFNFIDRDGKMEGLDIETVEKWKKFCVMPLTIVGGVGSLEDIKNAINSLGIVGIGCGSLFVYKGRHKGVLINYPNLDLKKKMIGI